MSGHASAPLRNGLMITWRAGCFRSSATGAALGVPVHYVWPDARAGKISTLWCYACSVWRTWVILARARPQVVVVANLPVFAVIAVWLAGLVLRHRIVMDVHSEMWCT